MPSVPVPIAGLGRKKMNAANAVTAIRRTWAAARLRRTFGYRCRCRNSFFHEEIGTIPIKVGKIKFRIGYLKSK